MASSCGRKPVYSGIIPLWLSWTSLAFAGGCNDGFGNVSDLPPARVDSPGSVEDRSYFDAQGADVEEAAILALQGLLFIEGASEPEKRGALAARLLEGHRANGSKARVLIEDIGGGEIRVYVEVTPSEEGLAGEILDGISRRISDGGPRAP